jgi:NAD+ synthetase
VVGLSGGIDSALTAYLATIALGKGNVEGITMPSEFSSEGSVTDSIKLSDSLGIRCWRVPIGELHHLFRSELKRELETGHQFMSVTGVTNENLQARIRGIILMARSNETGALVLSTGNKSELAVGYCTLYGDMCGGLNVLGDVPKTTVFELAKAINREQPSSVRPTCPHFSPLVEIIPWSIINKPPSAELAPDQKDSDTLPDYETLDRIVDGHMDKHLSAEQMISLGYGSEETVKWVVKRIFQSEYKRAQSAPSIRVTRTSFSFGWDMPIATGNMRIC